MKVLFIDQSAELQQKWIQPLRSEGWGVIRARSVEDASRIMMLHGEGVEAMVLSEEFSSFAAKWNLPYVVLTRKWNQTEILKHQNSAAPAFAYLPYECSVHEMKKTYEARMRGGLHTVSLKATGTEGLAASNAPMALKLEEFSDVMSRPEKTGNFPTDSSIHLQGATVYLGGKKQEIKPADVGQSKLYLVPEPVARPEISEPSEGKTTILESTQLEELPEFLPELEEVSSMELPPLTMSHSSVGLGSSPLGMMNLSPGSDGNSSDAEVLKSYLALREQDVAVLTGQVRSSYERIQQLEQLLKAEKSRSNELFQQVQKQELTIKDYNREKQVEMEALSKQVEDLDAQLKERTDKARTIEARLKVALEEVDQVKQRVRVDIRRIRVREKELENQLEILKKDSTALLIARDEKIMELKRKLDLIEFNMELVQEQYNKERTTAEDLKHKLKDAAQVMRQAGGMLES